MSRQVLLIGALVAAPIKPQHSVIAAKPGSITDLDSGDSCCKMAKHHLAGYCERSRQSEELLAVAASDGGTRFLEKR
jgi:hypothetical protein